LLNGVVQGVTAQGLVLTDDGLLYSCEFFVDKLNGLGQVAGTFLKLALHLAATCEVITDYCLVV
jgi:hypothetical protein